MFHFVFAYKTHWYPKTKIYFTLYFESIVPRNMVRMNLPKELYKKFHKQWFDVRQASCKYRFLSNLRLLVWSSFQIHYMLMNQKHHDFADSFFVTWNEEVQFLIGEEDHIARRSNGKVKLRRIKVETTKTQLYGVN